VSPIPNATTAAEQLRRLLLVLPTLADDQVHSLDAIAARIGSDAETVRRDLISLINRDGDEPGGFTEGVSLLLEADTVQLQTPNGHFRRPMALTRTELHALELGIAMLAQELPPDEHVVLHGARERLHKALAKMPATDAVLDATHHGSFGTESDHARQIRRELQSCIRDRRIATIGYRAAMQEDDDQRRVYPLGVIWSRGAWYLAAWCERSNGLRVFRFDRIATAVGDAERFRAIDGFELDAVLRDGRVLVGDVGAPMRVRYGVRIARWIAEREGTPLEEDGSTIVEHEAITEEWAVRHVLRYGPDAEILEPAALREAVVRRLSEIGA
jgi:proteasome accessory factor C